MYLIEMSYGEYDDHNEIPILITPGEADASLIADDLNENPNSEYLVYAREAYDKNLPPDAYFSYRELRVACADYETHVSYRESKRRFLAEELRCWEGKRMREIMEESLLTIIANELSWRFLVRIVNRLRKHRLHIAQIHTLNQKHHKEWKERTGNQ